MTRLWSRRTLRGNGDSRTISPSPSSGRWGRRSSNSPRRNDDDDDDVIVETPTSPELNHILDDIGNTVATLPWEITLTSSEDGHTESCIVPRISTELDERHIKSGKAKWKNAGESTFETTMCQMMDVMEQGMPQCIDFVMDTATNGIFPVQAESKYHGIASLGSLHSM